MKRKSYPSDLTDVEWQILEPLIPPSKKQGHPREQNVREIINAIFYVSMSGCSWRMLPHDLPCWQTAYDYFRKWRDDGVWQSFNTKLRERGHSRKSRPLTPQQVVLDRRRRMFVSRKKKR